jgi:LysM repeat protein
MRFFRALAPLLALPLFSGCGYIHFGRLSRQNDPALQEAYSNLALEHKILKQELVLARKETESLRSALERTGVAIGLNKPELARELEKTAQELATLRVDYAKLKAERATTANAAETMASVNTTTLQEENVRLRRDLNASRQENAALAEQLKTSVAQNEQAQASLAQLNTELLGQKQARERAEQAIGALRAQLEAVMARAGRVDDTIATAAVAVGQTTAVTPAPEATPNPLAALQNAKAPPSGAVPIVELRTTLDRTRTAAGNTATAISSPAVAPPITSPEVTTANVGPAPSSIPARAYTVQPGDTLEKIAIKVYGAADQWGKIYDANVEALGSGQGLRAGMKLLVPEK